MNRIKLTLRSLVYSQMQVETYVVVLAEENGKRKLPIVIGTHEAQAIAIALDALTPSRPFTHDLFVNFATAHNISIIEVEITKFEEGVFSAELTCESYSGRIRIDARTSDAVALAIRFKCPIYVSDEILDRAGIMSNDFENFEEEIENFETSNDLEHDFKQFGQEELEDLLQDLIKEENYELASEVRDELKRRKIH